MGNLLSANFARMFKSRIFRFSVILSAVIFFSNLIDIAPNNIEEGAFRTVPFAMLIVTVFTVRFVAAEHEANAIRNKIVVGNSRLSIYLSNFVVCAAGSLIICAVSMGSIFASMLIFIDGAKSGSPPEMTALCLVGTFFAVVSLAAVLSALSLLTPKTAVNAIVCIILVIGLAISNELVGRKLQEPEKMKVLNTGDAVEYEKMIYGGNRIEADRFYSENAEYIPNLYYVGGTKRKVYEFSQNINPISQSQAIINAVLPYEYKDPTKAKPIGQLPYSIGLTAVVSAIGVLLFSRKDIK